MLIVFASTLETLVSILRSRAALALEILALRHQIGALQRSAAKCPNSTSGDRLFWICLSRLRRELLLIARPVSELPVTRLYGKV
jgi:hypothetical protein